MRSGVEARAWSEAWIRIREATAGGVLLVGVSVGIPWAVLEGLRTVLTLPGAGPA